MKNIDKRPFKSKQMQKRIAGCCRLCGCKNYETLDAHRIIWGKENGKYRIGNVVVCCANCHRLEQAGKIKIDGWYNSTAGKLLHWFDEDGVEHFS